MEKVLAEWVLLLSDQQAAALPAGIDEQMSLLIEYLRNIAVFSSWIMLKRSCARGAGRPLSEGYERYGQLMRRIGEMRHQSCLLLTSREKPRVCLSRRADYPVRTLSLSNA